MFLGQFGEQYVALSLAGLPAHDSISITFNFYAINTWDGNLYPGYPGAAPDIFGLDVNGVDTLLYATFANNLNLSEYQTYPSNYPLHGGAPVNNFPETGAYSICQLDFPNPDWWGRIGPEDEDAEYHLTYTFANSGNTVLLNFLGDAMQEAPTTLGDESWGLDSIVVQTLFHQPVISYIIPDIGSPDMNTYVDIIGPYNTDTNFGIDSLYMNNPGDQVQVVCATPSDTQYIRFGPCMVSWNGRMISTQAYVMPWVQATSANWQNGIKIPIQVLLNGVASNIDTFYIVKPQPLGTLGVPGLIGSGGAYGIRSRRGAMIVDSLVLTGTGTYGVSTTDCDPKTPGNQGYLPLVIISNGPVRMDPGSKLDVSAAGANAGPGGGGGGNGLTCGMIAGNGFTGGGGNANWYSGCGDIPAGTGTGQNQNGLNGVLGGVSSTQNEGGGGGTGHPFGIGGGAGGDTVYSGGGPPGYGGGSGGPEFGTPPRQGGGGGAGYVYNGSNGGVWANVFPGGKPYGNAAITPLAGGSGGGGGNVNNDLSGAGSGGGGGGAAAIYAQLTGTFGPLIAIGGNGDSSANNGAGGGGSGGAIVCGSKLGASLSTVDVDGGLGGGGYPVGQGQDGGNSGSGRLRIDALQLIPPIIKPTGVVGASEYIGPSTDTQSFVGRTFTLAGTGNDQDIRIYVRPLSSAWYLAATISNGGTSWSTPITLPGTDTIYLLAALQGVHAPSSAAYTANPSWVLSQAAANILRIDCSPPTAAINLNKSPLLCAGDSLILAAAPLGLHYQWLKNSQMLPVTSDSLTVSDSGVYSVIVSNSSNCSDSAAVTVRFISAPVAGILGPHSICAGGSAILAATPVGFHYKWMKDGQLILGDTDSIVVTDAGIYGVIVSNGGDCSDSTAVRVTIDSAPVAGISGPLSMCLGGSIVLKASPGGVSYQWIKDGQQLVSTDSLVVTDSGAYSLIVTNASGCSDSTAVTVTLNPIPTAAINGPQSLCTGSTVVLEASPAGLIYNWFKNGRPLSSTADSLTVTDSGKYSVVVSNTSGCSDSATVTLAFDPAPIASIKGSPFLCSDGSEVLKAAPSNVTYVWKKDGVPQPVTSDSLLITIPGDYSVIVTNSSGCSDSAALQVQEDAFPIPVITASDTVTRDGTILTASTGTSYLWSTGDTTQAISVSQSGQYVVTVTDSNGCSATSLALDFVPSCIDALLQESLEGIPIAIDGIIPNPAHDVITVSFNASSAQNYPIRYEIDDVLGRTLVSGEIWNPVLSLSTTNLPQGVLCFRAQSSGFECSERFVVMR